MISEVRDSRRNPVSPDRTLRTLGAQPLACILGGGGGRESMWSRYSVSFKSCCTGGWSWLRLLFKSQVSCRVGLGEGVPMPGTEEGSSAWPWPGTYVLPHPMEHASPRPLLHTEVTAIGMGWDAGDQQERDRLGTDVESTGQKERELGSEEMFLEGDKARPASSGNCFV